MKNRKNKLVNLLKTGIFLFGISFLLCNCENTFQDENISPEKNTIKYGISKEKLLNLKITNSITAKIQAIQKENYNQKTNNSNRITLEELLERLNLEKTYYSLTDSTEVLNAPVKNFGNYKRNFLSITTGNINSSYLITYPNAQNNNIFYVSNLNGQILQKTVIQENGIGKNTYYNNIDNTSAKSETCAEHTVYEKCSSGNHSFANLETVWQCDYWTNLNAGTPPSVVKIPGDCSNSNSGGGNIDGGSTGNPTNPSGGISVAPVGGGGLPTNLEQECVANLDCEECDLPGDLNRDCTIDEYEGCLMLGYTNEVCECSVNGGNIDECVIANEIDALTITNPYALLEVDCDQIQNWQSLAQHTPPQNVKDKVKNLQENHEALLGDWNIQYLESAGGKVVNMDYFAVNITTLPNNPNTGQQFTSVQFLDFFRRNINNFVSGTNFSPYCEVSAICQQETTLWNSNNPLGALIKLDISLYNGPGGNILANDGVVISAESTSNYWRFMTMEAPYDSEHPVTGTRQFGIEQNSNGSYNIYVRGVDRFTSRIQEATVDIFTDPFLFADSLWESFQEKTNQFINSNGGVSSINTPITNRPNWNKVKEVLEGNRPVSDLGCN